MFSKAADCPALKGADPSFLNAVGQINVIDEGDIKYFKIYSLYCWEYDPKCDYLKKPDKRMKDFGNSAVVIIDFNEFMDRFARALFSKYKYLQVLMDRVSFYGPEEARIINPLFDKRRIYEYQNELRLAFIELEKNVFSMASNEDLCAVLSLDRVTIDIGDIRDIAFSAGRNRRS